MKVYKVEAQPVQVPDAPFVLDVNALVFEMMNAAMQPKGGSQ